MVNNGEETPGKRLRIAGHFNHLSDPSVMSELPPWSPNSKVVRLVDELAPDWSEAMSGLERKLARFQAADSHLTAALTPAIHSGQESNAFNDLAGLLNETHRQVEAEPLFRRALEIKER